MSRCNFSVLNADQINRSQLNSSPSKFRYSFSKDDRFAKINSNCPLAYYNVNDVRGKRSTSFGYGIKSDFTKDKANSPSPDNYAK